VCERGNLDNTAAIRVHGERGNLAAKRRDYEADVLNRYQLYALLYHVIAILVPHTLHLMPFQFSYQLLLLLRLYHLQGLQY
jgi:hypothetical protein